MFKISRSLLYLVRFKSKIESNCLVRTKEIKYEIIIKVFVKSNFIFIIQYPISNMQNIYSKIFINCKKLFILN